MSSAFAGKASLSATSSGPIPGQTCGEHIQAIDAPISETASFADVVLGLADSPRLFVRVLGAVGGIITMSDLQKPPVRMWLFGMITLLEMRMSRLID